MKRAGNRESRVSRESKEQGRACTRRAARAERTEMSIKRRERKDAAHAIIEFANQRRRGRVGMNNI